ncbi:MAG: hypothetical protein U1F68_10650 [Gammaproteobacteria bacterium]
MNCVVDVAIVGGGIAGLWLLALAPARDYARCPGRVRTAGRGDKPCARRASSIAV